MNSMSDKATILKFQRKTLASVNSGPLPEGVLPIGIDLGTSHSVVSIYSSDGSHPQTLDYAGENLVPSLLFWSAADEQLFVGKKAKEALSGNAEHVVRGTKRHMGAANVDFYSGNKSFTPEAVAELILRHLVHHPILIAEREKYGIVYAVITVPAHFDDAARQATLAAATEAGIYVLRIVNEPTAAALAYSLLPNVDVGGKETLAVFDFGGGTFDVSIVERQGMAFHVLASEGDVKLGGDDLDRACANFLLTKLQFPEHLRDKTFPEEIFISHLLPLAEQIKKQLAQEGEVKLDILNLGMAGVSLSVALDRDTYHGIVTPFIQRTLALTQRALHAAKRKPAQLSRILLVGGSTRLPLVRTLLEAYFPTTLIDGRLEPDLAVSWGAASQAAIILGLDLETMLVDVCSHTLGIGVAEDSQWVQENFDRVAAKYGIKGDIDDLEIRTQLQSRYKDFQKDLHGFLRVAPIIHRNSPLPACRSEFFHTLYNDQKAIHVVLVQGEGNQVCENRLLGSFLFKLVTPVFKGTRCEIQLTYDVNGLVQVVARQIGTSNVAKAQFDSRTAQVEEWTVLDDAAAAAPSDKQKPALVNHTNSLAVRCRRKLMTLSVDSQSRLDLQRYLAEYEKLLNNTENMDESEIERCEQKLEELLS